MPVLGTVLAEGRMWCNIAGPEGQLFEDWAGQQPADEQQLQAQQIVPEQATFQKNTFEDWTEQKEMTYEETPEAREQMPAGEKELVMDQHTPVETAIDEFEAPQALIEPDKDLTYEDRLRRDQAPGEEESLLLKSREYPDEAVLDEYQPTSVDYDSSIQEQVPQDGGETEQLPVDQVYEQTPAVGDVIPEAEVPVVEREPEVTTEVLEGEVTVREDVNEHEEQREDGYTIRQRVTTLQHVKPVIEVIFTDGVETDRLAREVVVGTETDKDIYELPPGVDEPWGENIECETSVEEFEETLPDGSWSKSRVNRTMVTRLPEAAAPMAEDLEKMPEEIPEGATVDEFEETQPDGTVVKKRVICTRVGTTLVIRTVTYFPDGSVREDVIEEEISDEPEPSAEQQVPVPTVEEPVEVEDVGVTEAAAPYEEIQEEPRAMSPAEISPSEDIPSKDGTLQEEALPQDADKQQEQPTDQLPSEQAPAGDLSVEVCTTTVTEEITREENAPEIFTDDKELVITPEAQELHSEAPDLEMILERRAHELEDELPPQEQLSMSAGSEPEGQQIEKPADKIEQAPGDLSVEVCTTTVTEEITREESAPEIFTDDKELVVTPETQELHSQAPDLEMTLEERARELEDELPPQEQFSLPAGSEPEGQQMEKPADKVPPSQLPADDVTLIPAGETQAEELLPAGSPTAGVAADASSPELQEPTVKSPQEEMPAEIIMQPDESVPVEELEPVPSVGTEAVQEASPVMSPQTEEAVPSQQPEEPVTPGQEGDIEPVSDEVKNMEVEAAEPALGEAERFSEPEEAKTPEEGQTEPIPSEDLSRPEESMPEQVEQQPASVEEEEKVTMAPSEQMQQPEEAKFEEPMPSEEVKKPEEIEPEQLQPEEDKFEEQMPSEELKKPEEIAPEQLQPEEVTFEEQMPPEELKKPEEMEPEQLQPMELAEHVVTEDQKHEEVPFDEVQAAPVQAPQDDAILEPTTVSPDEYLPEDTTGEIASVPVGESQEQLSPKSPVEQTAVEDTFVEPAPQPDHLELSDEHIRETQTTQVTSVTTEVITQQTEMPEPKDEVQPSHIEEALREDSMLEPSPVPTEELEVTQERIQDDKVGHVTIDTAPDQQLVEPEEPLPAQSQAPGDDVFASVPGATGDLETMQEGIRDVRDGTITIDTTDVIRERPQVQEETIVDEQVSVDHRAPPGIEIDEDLMEEDLPVAADDFPDDFEEIEEVLPDGSVVKRRVSKTRVKKVVTRKVRRVGPDGEIVEDVFTEEVPDSELFSETSSVRSGLSDARDYISSPVPSMSPTELSAQDDGDAGVRVYTDTIEGEPTVETDVQEFEETLPDGTVVKRKVIKTKQKQTIMKRVIMEGPESELPATEEQAQAILDQAHYEPEMTRYTDRLEGEPESATDVQEYEEVLSDGTVVKRRVITTTEAQMKTERTVLEGDQVPGFEDEMVPAGEVFLETDPRAQVQQAAYEDDIQPELQDRVQSG